MDITKYPLEKLLKETGVSQQFIADKLKITRQAVNAVVRGRDKSSRIEKTIREYCEKLYL